MESVTAQVDEIEDRDCYNRQSKYTNSKNRPSCYSHPTGALRYFYHDVYDHLLNGTATRRNAGVVLTGDKHLQTLLKLYDVATDYFDAHKPQFQRIELKNLRDAGHIAELEKRIVAFASEYRNDLYWREQEDKIYVDLALKVFIDDCFKFWRNKIPQAHATARQNNRLPSMDIDIDNVYELFRQLHDSEQYSVFDPESSLAQHSSARKTPSYSSNHGTDLVLRKEFLPDQPAPSAPISCPDHPEPTLTHLEAENRKLRATISSQRQRIIQLDSQLHDHDTTRSQIHADNAQLAITLAAHLKLRKNSKNSILGTLTAKTHLTRKLAGRLLDNDEFVRVWLPAYQRVVK